MDVKAQTETELEMMKGIVAMLLSFARLAELVSRAPYPIRSFVLWLLRRAETVVRDWVYCSEDEYWPVAIHAGSDRADALDLAASLRALARAVRQMAAEYRRFTRRWRGEAAGGPDDTQRRGSNGFRRAGILRRLLQLASFGLAPCPDTS